MNLKIQSGRSMVEMLGTLAIIGVLSIGGIAGYSYGMDKYRANETINDVNLRGIDLVRQVAMGQTLSLSEWPTVSKAGYDISAPVLSTEGDAYFSISGVPKRVCEMVYDGIMQNQTTDVEVNGYVVDDSSDCGDDNKMGFFFITNAGEGGANPEELCKDVSCPEGSSCTYGICMTDELPDVVSQYIVCKNADDKICGECSSCNNIWAGLVCTPIEDGTPCSNGTCYQGDCVPSECSKNDDCLPYGLDYYCADTNESETNAHPKYCKKLNFTKKIIDLGNGFKEMYFISNNSLSWWDAMSACNALNASPITKEAWTKWVEDECTKPNSWSVNCRENGRVYHLSGTQFWIQDSTGETNCSSILYSCGWKKNYYGDSGPIKALCYAGNTEG